MLYPQRGVFIDAAPPGGAPPASHPPPGLLEAALDLAHALAPSAAAAPPAPLPSFGESGSGSGGGGGSFSSSQPPASHARVDELEPLRSAFVGHTFFPAAGVAATSDDDAVVASAVRLLIDGLRLSPPPPPSAPATPAPPDALASEALRVSEVLLSRHSSDGAASCAGPLLVSLIRRRPSSVAPLLRPILVALAARLGGDAGGGGGGAVGASSVRSSFAAASSGAPCSPATAAALSLVMARLAHVDASQLVDALVETHTLSTARAFPFSFTLTCSLHLAIKF